MKRDQKRLRVLVDKKLYIALVVLVVTIIGYRNISIKSEVDVLRLGLNIDLNKTHIDPVDINNLSKAIISDNIYARLISYEDGILKPWLANSFVVDGNKITLIMAEAKTSSGRLINARDVKVSLERLLKLDTNTHAKLQRFLDFNDPTGPLIEVSSSVVEIKLRKSKYVKTFLRILSSSEYGIVPFSALNADLKIVDYKETTGAFYLNENKLYKNPFFKSENEYANEIQVINSGSSTDLMQLFIDGKVDILPTTVNLNQNVLEKRLSGYEFNLFKTDKIKLFLAAFGPGGLSNFTSNERAVLIRSIQKGLLKSYPIPVETEITSSFFPTIVSSEISTDVEINDVAAKIPLNFVSYTGLEDAMSGINENKSIKVNFTEDFPLEFPFAKRPESFFMMCDVAFDDDYTLYSYVLNNNIIPVSESEKEYILDNVLEMDDANSKRDVLNAFHTKAISERLVGPLFRAPYTILTRKPLVSHQTRLSASTKLWQIY